MTLSPTASPGTRGTFCSSPASRVGDDAWDGASLAPATAPPAAGPRPGDSGEDEAQDAAPEAPNAFALVLTSCLTQPGAPPASAAPTSSARAPEPGTEEPGPAGLRTRAPVLSRARDGELRAETASPAARGRSLTAAAGAGDVAAAGGNGPSPSVTPRGRDHAEKTAAPSHRQSQSRAGTGSWPLPGTSSGPASPARRKAQPEPASPALASAEMRRQPLPFPATAGRPRAASAAGPLAPPPAGDKTVADARSHSAHTDAGPGGADPGIGSRPRDLLPDTGDGFRLISLSYRTARAEPAAGTPIASGSNRLGPDHYPAGGRQGGSDGPRASRPAAGAGRHGSGRSPAGAALTGLERIGPARRLGSGLARRHDHTWGEDSAAGGSRDGGGSTAASTFHDTQGQGSVSARLKPLLAPHTLASLAPDPGATGEPAVSRPRPSLDPVTRTLVTGVLLQLQRQAQVLDQPRPPELCLAMDSSRWGALTITVRRQEGRLRVQLRTANPALRERLVAMSRDIEDALDATGFEHARVEVRDDAP